MIQIQRRRLLGGLGVGLAGFAAPAILRAQDLPPLLPATPFQTEGPFYPYDDLPTDQDADLVRVTGQDAQALGEITHLTGTVRGQFGEPLGGALVEIWQCDTRGRYLHGGDPNTTVARDVGFQGYGKTLADRDGAFRFRTIKPVAYSAMTPIGEIRRAPHVHVAVSTRGIRRLTTQLYVAGEPLNDPDIVLRDVVSAEAREGLIRPYAPGSGEETGALAVHYDLIVGI